MNHKRKQQSAMEYLMTYGWSILIIAIVLAALFSLGVFSNSNLGPRAQPNNCRIFRPNGPGTTTNINTEGVCNGELPEYIASFGGPNAGSYVAIPNSQYLNFNGASAISISAWVEPTAYASDNDMGTIVTRSSTYYLQIDGATDTNPGDVAVYITGSGYVFSNAQIPLNKLTFVAVTYNGNDENIYINGNLDSVHAATGAIASTNNYVGIGANLGGGGNLYGVPYDRRFQGMISNVQIYSTVLDANAISALYLGGIGGSPIEPQYIQGWWPLNGDTSDYSGNGGNGVPTNVMFTNAWSGAYTTP